MVPVSSEFFVSMLVLEMELPHERKDAPPSNYRKLKRASQKSAARRSVGLSSPVAIVSAGLESPALRSPQKLPPARVTFYTPSKDALPGKSGS